LCVPYAKSSQAMGLISPRWNPHWMENTDESGQLTGFPIGKPGLRRLVEKPDENANECQSVAFGSIP
jgi:hypothetical protein